MTAPTLKLDSAIGNLTDYGEDARFTVTRGGGPQQNGFIAEAGKLGNCTLTNISRELDPLWTPGPFFGQIRRQIDVTATATWGATEYPMLVGRADDIPQSYPNQGTEQIVDLGVTDLFDFLNAAPVNIKRPPEKTSQRIVAVLDAINYPGAMDIQPGMSVVCGDTIQTDSALSHLGDCTQVEYGELGIDAAGTLRFRGRPAITSDTRSTAVQAEYVQGPGDGFNFVDISRGSLPIINHVEVTYGHNGRSVVVEDAASISAYGYQPQSISLPFETESQAHCYGSWLLLLYAQPRDTILSLTFDPVNEPGDDIDLWAELLGRAEGDLVQVTLDPLAGDALSGEPIVKKQWWRGAQFDFETGLVQVAVQDSWVDGLFYWDSSDLDGPDFYGL